MERHLVKCSKCGHEWMTKSENPRSCPNCRKYLIGKRNNRRYNFKDMQVGDEIKLERNDNFYFMQNLSAAVSRYNSKHGKIKKYKTDENIILKRIA